MPTAYTITIACGNPACGKPAAGPQMLRCLVCLAKTYCSPACQNADRSIHSPHCHPAASPPNSLALTLEKSALDFTHRFSQRLILLALAVLNHHKLPNSPLRDRIWEQQSRNNALVVLLQELPDMPAGTPDRKRVAYKSFHSATMDRLDRLRPCKEAAWAIQKARAPAVTIALIVSDRGGRMTTMITSTHSIGIYANMSLNPDPEMNELMLKVEIGSDL
ncbi:hypothetical protein BD779DRAFT_682941 [Infundibulicybe gibba]|nr:hypothetical protein BD779DRAFT_682941 [Infundibulicybe gibba]